MTSFKTQKIISIICSGIGFLVSLYMLICGLLSFNADGWDKLGIVLIFPSAIVFTVILIDFLMTVEVIKGGLIWSCISSLIKIIIIVWFIPSFEFDLFYLGLLALLLIVTIPSIFNIKRLKPKW